MMAPRPLVTMSMRLFSSTAHATRLAPFLVLSAGLVATVLVTLSLRQASRAEDEARFENSVERASRTIEERMEHYTSLLRAGSAFVGLREELTGGDFRLFVEHLYTPRIYPGIQGIGFAEWVPAAERERFLSRVREENPSYEISPPGARTEYFPIVYLEPQDRRNQAAIGYDMFSEPVRREAMIEARDEGAAAASGRVTLVQEIDEQKQAGFLIYVPAYRGGGVPPTVEARRRDLLGFVYSPFRADDLIVGIFLATRQPSVSFEIYDGEPRPENLLHHSPLERSPNPLLAQTRQIAVAGRPWTLFFQSTPVFDSASRQGWIPWVFSSGVVLSLIFFGITMALSRVHRTAEAARREESRQREQLRVTLASIGDAVIATDDSGRVTFMNQVAEQLTGWRMSESRGRPLAEVFRIVDEETRESRKDPVRLVLAEMRVIALSNHTLLVARDGTERAIADSAAPIRNDRGEIIGVVLVFQDVTEQQEARRALQQSEARSSAILESALDAIVTSNEEGEIVEWNPAAERIFRYSREEVIGRQMADLIIPPQWRERHHQGMARYRATGEAHVLGRRIEIQAMRKGGEEFMVELAITRLSAEGPAMFTAHVRDITERKRAEQALREAQEKLNRHAESLEEAVAERTARLQELVGELEAFSYSLSHDMRAPLRAIQGMGSALQEDYGEKIGAEGNHYLQRIMSAAVRLDRLIQDVLSYSRVVRSDIEVKRVDVDALVSEIVDQYAELQPPNAEIHIRRPLLPVRGQEASLTQCISNLLSNAVKFVPPGVRPRVEVWTEELDGRVRLYVKDNGIGIEPKHRERIFKIFERVHPDHTFAGTGIGLAIVRKGVERMGGSMGLESEPGKGSTFWIELTKGE